MSSLSAAACFLYHYRYHHDHHWILPGRSCCPASSFQCLETSEELNKFWYEARLNKRDSYDFCIVSLFQWLCELRKHKAMKTSDCWTLHGWPRTLSCQIGWFSLTIQWSRGSTVSWIDPFSLTSTPRNAGFVRTPFFCVPEQCFNIGGIKRTMWI